MQIFMETGPLQAYLGQQKKKQSSVGLVPTMGALHEGHISLINASRKANAVTVCSIFVNPTQFNNPSDLEKYPRTPERDFELLREAGCDAVFCPEVQTMYPHPSQLSIAFGQLDKILEGEFRPGHFSGVGLVVSKLFNIVQPDNAYFGQKDFQQAAVIQRMVADLNFPVKIIVAPTLRERDGLAMSSRNKFLDAEQRAQAVILFHALQAAAAAVKKKSISTGQLKADLKKFITAAPLARLDYVEFFDPETLEPVAHVKPGAQMALAVFFGKTRLIDNAQL